MCTITYRRGVSSLPGGRDDHDAGDRHLLGAVEQPLQDGQQEGRGLAAAGGRARTHVPARPRIISGGGGGGKRGRRGGRGFGTKKASVVGKGRVGGDN